jgi:hypothetical protein
MPGLASAVVSPSKGGKAGPRVSVDRPAQCPARHMLEAVCCVRRGLTPSRIEISHLRRAGGHSCRAPFGHGLSRKKRCPGTIIQTAPVIISGVLDASRQVFGVRGIIAKPSVAVVNVRRVLRVAFLAACGSGRDGREAAREQDATGGEQAPIR